MTQQACRVTYAGRVQGVGFRATAVSLARSHPAVAGWVRNLPDGRVQVVAQGPRDACQRLLDLLQSGTTPGHVDKVIAEWSEVGDALPRFTER